VLALLAVALVWYADRQFELTPVVVTNELKTIAVLPFVDMSSGSDQGYFADGLSEELTNRLTQLDGLLVTGRTSSFYFKGRNEDLRDIGQRLSVNHILEGSIRKSGDELRISAQLIDVNSGFHLWSDTFDRPYQDIFEIQEEIAESVATALSITLSVGQLGRFEGGTDNLGAFDAFMLGSAVMREFTAKSTLRAIQHFNKAVELDPDFALAWNRLANTYRIAWLTLGNDDAEHWDRLADQALARALAIAPDAQYVLETAAYIQVDRRNWSGARSLLEKIKSVGPGQDRVEAGAYLDLMAKTGNIAEALSAKERWRSVDPLHPDLSMYLGHLYLSQDRIDDALAEFEAGRQLDGYRSQLSMEGLLASLASGRDDLIRDWLDRTVEDQQPGAKGVNVAMRERFGDADAALSWLRAASAAGDVADYYVIVWGSYYGDYELALSAMRRSPDLWVFWTPLVQPLRGTPEFKEILVDVGLVDYWRQHGWNDYCKPSGELEFECS
jgi:TolB-like protein/thioredoxin-like negative regulator of GroEL